MVDFLKRRLRSSGLQASLSSIRFDTTGYEARGELITGQLRAWYTPEGDGLGLFFFAAPPDMPAGARTADDLRAAHAAEIRPSGGRIVEVSTLPIDGCQAVKVIFKTAQEPSGLTYVGSVTIPFRDFSFVIKIQCEEHSPTGLRETILLNRRLAAGEMPTLDVDGRMQLPGWDPDHESFDAEFPWHPLSRLRKVLGHVAGTVTIDAGVKGLAGFELPG